MSRKQILKKIDVHKQEIKKFRARKLGLFGSQAHGTATSKSDIDLLVEFNEKKFDNYMDLKFFLEKLFRKKVDLVLSDTLKPQLLPELKSAVQDML